MPRRTQAKCYITANDAKDKDTGVILKERERALARTGSEFRTSHDGIFRMTNFWKERD